MAINSSILADDVIVITVSQKDINALFGIANLAANSGLASKEEAKAAERFMDICFLQLQ